MLVNKNVKGKSATNHSLMSVLIPTKVTADSRMFGKPES